jgi:hypothetical protein
MSTSAMPIVSQSRRRWFIFALDEDKDKDSDHKEYS